MSTVSFKRGDTFQMTGVVKIAGVVQDMTGWTIKAQVRRKGVLGTAGLISELTCSWLNEVTASLKLLDTSTADWPTGAAEIDIRLTSPTADKTTSSTGQINILEAITRD